MTTFDDFAESPFGPLSQHMEKVKECVALVRPMFESILAERWDDLALHTQAIFRLEHEADQIKNGIRDQMPRSFALPIFRGDLLAYLKLQDAIADTVEDIGVVVTLKQLRAPKEFADGLQAYVEKVVEVCEILFRCTDQLVDLKESDLTGERGQEIMKLAAQAEHAEWESDKLEYDLSKQLFALDDELKATDIFLWSKVLLELGGLANHADKTAERLRRMLSR